VDYPAGSDNFANAGNIPKREVCQPLPSGKCRMSWLSRPPDSHSENFFFKRVRSVTEEFHGRNYKMI